MKSASEGHRNPFGVMDVPNSGDQEVLEFAASTMLDGSTDDENANAWSRSNDRSHHDVIAGNWSSRWNGGIDSTIPGDAADKWKRGRAEVRMAGRQVHLLFDWDRGLRKGLIEARREGANRLVGRYLNLSDPTVTRPWIGLIVCNQRIDGRWPMGRLDFRR
jgi:hypothetical protein